VQTNTHIVRTGDAVHIDLMLGNHGNDHRDFKLAGKLSPEMVKSFEVIAPDGKKYDLMKDMTDLGYAPKEGYYSSKFVPAKPGLYVAAQTLDKVLNHGKPIRGYRSAKAYFVVSDSLDMVSKDQPGFDTPLGHLLELVPEANPVVPMGPGTPIKVKLLFEGKPLAGVKVSFIPRGGDAEGRDRRRVRADHGQGRTGRVHPEGRQLLPGRRPLPPGREGQRLRVRALRRHADGARPGEVPVLRRLTL
jgi:uncharacterized GH25 family protein